MSDIKYPARFTADADTIVPLGNLKRLGTVDHLTDAERAENAEHDKGLAAALAAMREEEAMAEGPTSTES